MYPGHHGQSTTIYRPLRDSCGRFPARLIPSIALACLAQMFFTAPVLFAQVDNRGNCDLIVRVRTNDERTIETQIQVQVLTTQGILATGHIVGAENAQFRVNNGRKYSLAVTGIGIEPTTTDYFGINDLEMSHTETVHVKLTGSSNSDSPSNSPSVSVNEMNVPKRASAELSKGIDAFNKGDLEKASGLFEKSISLYPRYARAFHMLGLVAIKNSDRAKARDMFSKSIQMDEAFSPAYIDLARIELQDQDFASCETLLTKALSLTPTLPDATALLASAEFAAKEYDKALADVDRAHAMPNHEKFAEIHVMAGKVLASRGLPNAALFQFQLFLMEKPDGPEADSVRKTIAALTPQPKS